MSNYNFFTKNLKSTPQTQPIKGRESEMIQGRSGGYTFDAGIWAMLRRCLLIGTAQSTYYAGKRELTEDFITVVQEAIGRLTPVPRPAPPWVARPLARSAAKRRVRRDTGGRRGP